MSKEASKQAKEFKQIMGSISRPDLLFMEYDQAIKDGFERVRVQKAGTRIIVGLERERSEGVSVAETSHIKGVSADEIIVDELKEDSTEQQQVEQQHVEETPKTTTRKTTPKK